MMETRETVSAIREGSLVIRRGVGIGKVEILGRRQDERFVPFMTDAHKKAPGLFFGEDTMFALVLFAKGLKGNERMLLPYSALEPAPKGTKWEEVVVN